jgi:hypothetical protein
MNAMRFRDIDTIGRLFDSDVVWVDVAGGVACDGRDQALAWLRATPTELNEVDASSCSPTSTWCSVFAPI